MAKKNTFLSQLSLGNKAEAMVQQVLFLAGISTEQETNIKKNKDYDLKATNPNFTMEIKYDIYCARSGNIAIEYYNPKINKPSGLTSTKADIWVHIITNPLSIWFAKTDSLREFCNNTPPLRIIDAGGDKNSSMYLYKKETIFDTVFTRIDTLTKEELLNLISRLLNDNSISNSGGDK